MADRISIGTRDISKRALYSTQISLLIFGAFFVSDLVYCCFKTRKKYKNF